MSYLSGRRLVFSGLFQADPSTVNNDPLHRTCNGEPSYLREAIGLMYSLSLTARELMRTPSGLPDGTTAGPSFELP